MDGRAGEGAAPGAFLSETVPGLTCDPRFWWLPLTVIQTLRLDALLPMVAATAPLLAVAVGMDAFNSALNLLAVLFVLDADDLVYSCVFARHQRCMIEAIEFTVQADDQRRLNSVIFYALVAMALSMLCSIIIIVVIGSNPEISNSYNVMVMGFAEDFFFPTATSFFMWVLWSTAVEDMRTRGHTARTQHGMQAHSTSWMVSGAGACDNCHNLCHVILTVGATSRCLQCPVLLWNDCPVLCCFIVRVHHPDRQVKALVAGR